MLTPLQTPVFPTTHFGAKKVSSFGKYNNDEVEMELTRQKLVLEYIAILLMLYWSLNYTTVEFIDF